MLYNSSFILENDTGTFLQGNSLLIFLRNISNCFSLSFIFSKTVFCLLTLSLIVFIGILIKKSLSSWKIQFYMFFNIYSMFIFPLSSFRSLTAMRVVDIVEVGIQFLLSLYIELVFLILFMECPTLSTLPLMPRYHGDVVRDSFSSVNCIEAFSMEV